MHGGANRAVPAPVPVPAGAGVPFLDNASMPVWQASGVGADQVPNSGVHRAIFGCGGHASRQVEANVVRIAVSVYGDLLSSAASDPERACSFSPHSRDSCIESTCHVSYRIALLDAQGGAVPPVPPEKQPPQIRHLAAENRKEFWVRVRRALCIGLGLAYSRNFLGCGNKPRRVKGDSEEFVAPILPDRRKFINLLNIKIIFKFMKNSISIIDNPIIVGYINKNIF